MKQCKTPCTKMNDYDDSSFIFKLVKIICLSNLNTKIISKNNPMAIQSEIENGISIVINQLLDRKYGRIPKIKINSIGDNSVKASIIYHQGTEILSEAVFPLTSPFNFRCCENNCPSMHSSDFRLSCSPSFKHFDLAEEIIGRLQYFDVIFSTKKVHPEIKIEAKNQEYSLKKNSPDCNNDHIGEKLYHNETITQIGSDCTDNAVLRTQNFSEEVRSNRFINFPQLILISGCTGSGKSTLTSFLSIVFTIDLVISTDHIRNLLRIFLNDDELGHFLASTYEYSNFENYLRNCSWNDSKTNNLPEQGSGKSQVPPFFPGLLDSSDKSNPKPDHNYFNRRKSPCILCELKYYLSLSKKEISSVALYNMQCNLMNELIYRIVSHHLQQNKHIIVEGIHLSIPLLKRLRSLTPASKCTTFLIYVESSDTHMKNLSKREDFNRYKKHFETIRTIQKYILFESVFNSLSCALKLPGCHGCCEPTSDKNVEDPCCTGINDHPRTSDITDDSILPIFDTNMIVGADKSYSSLALQLLKPIFEDIHWYAEENKLYYIESENIVEAAKKVFFTIYNN